MKQLVTKCSDAGEQLQGAGGSLSSWSGQMHDSGAELRQPCTHTHTHTHVHAHTVSEGTRPVQRGWEDSDGTSVLGGISQYPYLVVDRRLKRVSGRVIFSFLLLVKIWPLSTATFESTMTLSVPAISKKDLERDASSTRGFTRRHLEWWC